MAALPGRRPPLLLELDLSERPAEPDQGDPIARLRARGRRQLRPTLRALHEAGSDRRVVGLVARVGGPLPWTVMQEVRLAVQEFAASGKPCVAWAETFDAGADVAAYVLATAFEEIWLQPGGGLGLLGVGVETTFVRGALDRLGIEPQLEQRAEYKNAADRILRTGFTPEHRESVERLSASIFTEAVARIAAGRKTTAEGVRQLIDTGPRTAEEALQAGLVDHIGYRDQVLSSLRERLSEDSQLLFADRWHPRRAPRLPARRRGHVALVEARGVIVSGRSRRGPGGRQVGSDTVRAELRSAADDERAGAIVLHIDSRGGSAVASETIWREVSQARESGKPVVVSMGAVAASGGYYIACPADVIVALPATLTGSIGVFGGKVVIDDLLRRLGLTTEAVGQGDRSLMFSSRRRFTDAELERFAAGIDAVYRDFVAKVAAGRGRGEAEIEAVAGGRVWTGVDAVPAGLVDELGGLRHAVRIARDRAGLPDDAPVVRAVHLSPLARLSAPKNSEDPRVAAAVVSTGLSGLGAELGLSGPALLMPPLKLR